MNLIISILIAIAILVLVLFAGSYDSKVRRKKLYKKIKDLKCSSCDNELRNETIEHRLEIIDTISPNSTEETTDKEIFSIKCSACKTLLKFHFDEEEKLITKTE